jgi:uncharacterized protein (DUF3084 family)
VAKSPTELIRDLTVQVGILVVRDLNRQSEVAELKNVVQKEREERQRLEVENATLKQQLQDHISQYQEWDRRRWGVIVLLLGAVLSLASGLIVTLAKK